MKIAPYPVDEKERLIELDRYEILDSLPEQEFDDFTFLASQICQTPIALISLVAETRQWFKSKVGVSVSESPRDTSFCSHTILQDDILIVQDPLKDERFFDHPGVIGEPHLRFYAGAPLRTPSGHHIGALCVVDKVPRVLSEQQINALRALSRQVVSQLELRMRKKSLRLAKEKAEEAVKTKSAFLANMSHEIRTPMNGIIGMTNILMSTIQDPQQMNQLKIIHSCGNSLLDLINDILEFSKLEVDRVELEKAPFSLHEACTEVVELLRTKASEKGIELSYDRDLGIPDAIEGDVLRFKQILTNLLGNGVKFTEKGFVRLSTLAEKLDEKHFEIKITVTDSGIGMASDMREKLFQPFSQVDASTTRKFGGSGLGLAICKGLCDLMGATIEVESTLGKGSTFAFRFKAEASISYAQNHSINPFAKYDAAMGAKFPLQILLVEDNHTNQIVSLSFLNKLGYQATLAENGKVAVELLKSHNYDLILMDCHMPEMDGFEAARRIRQDFQGEDRPHIIALSASSMKEDVDRCRASGMDDFLDKPLSIKKLARVLGEVVKQRQTRKVG